jgi:ABC-type nickel/cobalt efflux system permease component RcnA
MIGIWLVVRGLRHLRSVGVEVRHEHHHDHNHAAGEVCSSCGHKHGPTLAEAEQATSLRDALVLIGGIAIRPCTGALFVLLITWQMGIPMAGIAGAFVMALGTASVTVAVGIAASGFRGGLMRAVAQAGALTWMMPVVEVAAGLVVVSLSGVLLLRAL